jgi:hypothetical protein
MTTENIETPPVKLAYIIDGEIVDILHTDERLASIFLSNPIIIDISENFYDEENRPTIIVGAKYNQSTNTFENPE